MTKKLTLNELVIESFTTELSAKTRAGCGRPICDETENLGCSKNTCLSFPICNSINECN